MKFTDGLFSFCIYCQSVLRPKEAICGTCWDRLVEFSQPSERMGLYIGRSHCPIRSLFSWARDQHPQISLLIQSLKGGANPHLWPRLTDLFTGLVFGRDLNFIHESVLVPVPSKREVFVDHAGLFSRALSRDLGISVAHGGDSMAGSPQKTKSKWQRSQTCFNGRHNIPDEKTHAILVDDILTTGGTARALIGSIDQDRLKRKVPGLTWEIWVLAHRHLASNLRI